MQAAAMRRSATDATQDAAIPIIGIDHAGHEPIPGERDAATLTHREPGAMSAPFNGQDVAGSAWPLDEQRRRELVGEGGGHDALRHFDKR